MTPLEKVQKAIMEALAESPGVIDFVGEKPDVDGLHPIYGEFDIAAVARAAVIALRDPDEAALLPGFLAFVRTDTNCTFEEARNCWRAMIDATLSADENGSGGKV